MRRIDIILELLLIFSNLRLRVAKVLPIFVKFSTFTPTNVLIKFALHYLFRRRQLTPCLRTVLMMMEKHYSYPLRSVTQHLLARSHLKVSSIFYVTFYWILYPARLVSAKNVTSIYLFVIDQF